MPLLRSLQSWWSTVKQAWRKRGTAEGKKLLEELAKQVRRMLVGAFLALLLVFLGFPRLSAWYEAYKKRQLEPSRQVYLCVYTLQEFTLQPIDSVYVQVIGDEEATGYSNERGYCIITYEAEQGENEVKLTFIKEGYQPAMRPRVALPATEGDTTYCARVQLSPKVFKEADFAPPSEGVLN